MSETMSVPTPSQRFTVVNAKSDVPRGSEAWRLIDRAQLADGFPHSYPVEAVRLARAAMIELGDRGVLSLEILATLREMVAVLDAA